MKSLVLIGSGNVATHLAKQIAQSSYTIKQIYSRNLENAKALKNYLGIQEIEVLDNLEKIQTDADFYIISVSDNAIESIVNNLPKSIKGLILHTSGSTDINIFQESSGEDKFENYGVLYPLQTFSKQKEVNFLSIPFNIETNSADNLQKVRELALSLSPKVLELNSKQRMSLHVAAVFSCNFVNHMYVIAEKILKENHLDFELIRPLIRETADKALIQSPKEVQTGPAARKDQIIIQKHIDFLQGKTEISKLYMDISNEIMKGSH